MPKNSAGKSLRKYLKKTATEDGSTDAGDEGNTKKRELAAARIDCVGDAAAAAIDKKVEAMTAATLTTKDEVVALRSQNNIKEQIEEKGDEIKALIE